MIGSNTAGCTFFVKALQGSESSLPATVASAATNYFCSVSQKSNLFYSCLQFMMRHISRYLVIMKRYQTSVRHCRHRLNLSQRQLLLTHVFFLFYLPNYSFLFLSKIHRRLLQICVNKFVTKYDKNYFIFIEIKK